MSLTLITDVTAEPLTVAEALSQLRLESVADEPAPVAPTVALASPSIAGNVDNGAHRYLVTFVTADGETNAGAVSASVTVADKTVNGKVELTAIPLGGSSVTSRKLYRTVASGSTYLLLATIANNTATTYTDNIADSSLGAQAPSTNTTVDPYVRRLITAARQRAEVATSRQLITATWDWYLDAWPYGRVLEIPKPPLLSVTHVKYLNASGTLTAMTVTTDYTVSAPAGPRARRGRVSLAYGVSWPSARAVPDTIVVRFVAGYGATGSTVPAILRQAMLIDLSTLHEHRDDAVEAVPTPLFAERIYATYRSRARYGQMAEAA